jgi:uncharacterized ferritin-like protein (DUF455 family)
LKTHIHPSELARDERFYRLPTEVRFNDPRDLTPNQLPDATQLDVEERARRRMHGIFVGEIQALEGAGRTAFDFGTDEVPFELKFDMARQCWDEARHCEISVRLCEHMGGELGEYTEFTTLFEAACHDDPVFRLAGVNRALEGLAIDVFNQMREFGKEMHDPVMTFCEDFMLADEVTHVKMGSRWLREVTEQDPERRAAALEFQKVVDNLFNFRGARGEDSSSPLRLARRFREMAGFTPDEIDTIAAMAADSRSQYEAERAAADAARRMASTSEAAEPVPATIAAG